jgi:catechol 2,3-dioxygenase
MFMTLRPETPSGLNHLVLNVRDLDRAHDFWTNYLGFCCTGSWQRAAPDGKPSGRMRFYSGVSEGKLRHHDVGLIEAPSLPDAPLRPQVLHHIAITYPSRESWKRQIEFLVSRGVVPFRQVVRGATHSAHLHDWDGNEIELVYEHPRAEWEHDINAALNHAVVEPVGQ